MTGHTSTRPDGATARIDALIGVWRDAAADVLTLLRSLGEDDWRRPTDLPGWDVRAVAAHLAHLESVLAGRHQADVVVPEAAHLGAVSSRFTEAGVVARAGWPVERVLDELESSVAARESALRMSPPADLDAPGPAFAGALGWSWERLLTNRPVDLWMHEQDVRRAVGRPGGLDSAGARHTAGVFASALPYVLGRRVRPPAGTTVVLDVTGALPQVHAATVREDGRGVGIEPPVDPTARITLDLESWIVLSGGRRPAESVEVAITGDGDLARRTVASLAVTT
jgi:uncharacterized protein (TIGR03083 family)